MTRDRNDDDDDAPPRPARKPGSDAVQKGNPLPKKKPARPVDADDDEEEVRRPVKKKVRPRDDEDEPDDEPDSLRDNTLLNMLFPVGVSLWALSSNYFGVFGFLIALFGGLASVGMGSKMLGIVLPVIGGLMCLLAIPLGGLSFILRPKKTTYGGVTGYMRALIGILFGLIGIVAAPLIVYFLSQI